MTRLSKRMRAAVDAHWGDRGLYDKASVDAQVLAWISEVEALEAEIKRLQWEVEELGNSAGEWAITPREE